MEKFQSYCSQLPFRIAVPMQAAGEPDALEGEAGNPGGGRWRGRPQGGCWP